MSVRKRWITAGAAALALLVPGPALGWDETGHRVVARIAWEQMTPGARQAAVDLLLRAPADAGLRQLFPRDSRPLEVRQREFFLRASVWPDLARDNPKYHRGDWHYVNLFWAPGPGGAPAALDREPAGRAVERLRALSDSVADPAVPDSVRAVQLAWVLHLVGDIHQPLHASARVTPEHPEGDRGGNLFRLQGVSRNLHSWWDAAFTREFRWAPGEDEGAFVGRIASTVQRRQPRSRFEARLRPGEFMEWAEESVGVARRVAYTGVRPGQRPTAAYARRTYREAERRAALAGYRLAEMLNRRFGE